eukprot:TRINITY_DN10170_c0_g1_i1.p1 TRINITY_DN10170_c0_g1~~TRINITY_DN10170_c0_g1_i1.p1  ORF type:complete len:107 (+),score=7.17 TRINITY_DN10170_c0_g1_i1:79-399(+)
MTEIDFDHDAVDACDNLKLYKICLRMIEKGNSYNNVTQEKHSPFQPIRFTVLNDDVEDDSADCKHNRLQRMKIQSHRLTNHPSNQHKRRHHKNSNLCRRTDHNAKR